MLLFDMFFLYLMFVPRLLPEEINVFVSTDPSVPIRFGPRGREGALPGVAAQVAHEAPPRAAPERRTAEAWSAAVVTRFVVLRRFGVARRAFYVILGVWGAHLLETIIQKQEPSSRCVGGLDQWASHLQKVWGPVSRLGPVFWSWSNTEDMRHRLSTCATHDSSCKAQPDFAEHPPPPWFDV